MRSQEIEQLRFQFGEAAPRLLFIFNRCGSAIMGSPNWGKFSNKNNSTGGRGVEPN
jgi:hypothetical protein